MPPPSAARYATFAFAGSAASDATGAALNPALESVQLAPPSTLRNTPLPDDASSVAGVVGNSASAAIGGITPASVTSNGAPPSVHVLPSSSDRWKPAAAR